MRRPLLGVGLAVLVLIPAVAGFAAVSVKREFTLQAFEGWAYRPRVAGDWIIANQNSESNNNSTGQAVNAYNLVTGEVKSAFVGKASWPEAGGGSAIWTVEPVQNITSYFADMGMRQPNCGKGNLIVMNLATGRYYTPVMQNGYAYQYDVWGNYAVFTERGQGNVGYLDLVTGARTQLTQGAKQRFQPSIWGPIIIWLEDDTGSKTSSNSAPLQIRGCNTGTRKKIDIPQDSNVRHNSPATDGQTIVWWQAGKPNVVMGYDIRTGKVSQIAQGYFPDIDKGIVVYMKNDSKVYGKVLKTGQEFQISKGISNQGPTIGGRWVAWTVSSQDNKIHCAELSGIEGLGLH